MHGARTPFLGVNPVSFAFPTSDGTVSADMPTTLAPTGVLWEARRSRSPLPRAASSTSTARSLTTPTPPVRRWSSASTAASSSPCSSRSSPARSSASP
ncbi:hypothetical protein ABZ566_21635 [Streptomyces hygroscopicus]|uniref:hypothetical protein n=1 Tax=Streptomyces hygroscopicus TaxID=1912 RepID=UPI00207BBA23